MNQNQRKQRRKEMKAKIKAAKRLKREAENPAPTQPAQTTEHGTTETPVEAQRSRPDVHSLQDEVHMAHGKMHRAEAEVVEAGTAEMLGDDEAIAMLTRAARSLDDVIQYVESVLKRLPAQQVAEAMAIKDEPRRPGEKSRNGANPAVQLINIRLRAKSLMLRVMRILKPDLAKKLQKA